MVTLDEAKDHLPDLIEAAASGEDIFIQKNENIMVQLVPRETKNRRRQFGSAKGLLSTASNFDAPLEDFQEYVE